jgi:lipopolysaccharide/colanic/teichoic acid biosynthesis glycosyltransferase
MLKRSFDIVVSVTAMIALLPVFIVLAVTSRIMLGRNILFYQDRVGFRDRIFRIMKFRTMREDRDANGQLLPDEVRLTAYGRFLRSTSLDELPGLLNVVRGDMSLVGPRPLLVKYLDRYSPEQRRRHDVRPGVTGLAQVNGRNAVTWDERLAWDVQYVDTQSFRGDLEILWKTVAIVFSRHGVNNADSATMTEFLGSHRRPDL